MNTIEIMSAKNKINFFKGLKIIPKNSGIHIMKINRSQSNRSTLTPFAYSSSSRGLTLPTDHSDYGCQK